MSSVLLIWGLVLSGSALLLNAFALVILLNSWHLYQGTDGGSVGGDGREGKREKVGYLVFVSLLFANLMFVIFSKVPFLHRDWHGHQQQHHPRRFLFGPHLCPWTHLVGGALALSPHVLLCFYLGHVWLRIRRRRTPVTVAATAATAAAGKRSPFKDAAILVAAAAAWSVAVAAVVAYRMNMDYSVEEASLCLSTWRDSLWLSAFWWLLGHLGPVGLISLPAMLNLCRSRRRLGRQLRCCVTLAALGILSHCLLSLPSFVKETVHWARALRDMHEEGSHHGPHRGHTEANQTQVDTLAVRREWDQYSAAADFVMFLLTRVLPELRQLYLPAGVMVVLPVRFSCKLEEEEEGERENATVEKDVYATISEASEERELLDGGREATRKKMKRRRRKSGRSSATPVAGREEDVEVGVVTAEIHQRLSRSRTTIV